MRPFAYAVVPTILLAFAALAAACGDGGEALTLEEYFQQLDAAENQLSQEGEQLPEPELNDDDVFDEQEKQSFRENSDASVALLEDFRNTVADLDPPDEVQEQHNAALARFDEFIEAFRQFGDRVQDFEATSDLEDAFAEFDPAEEALTQACFDLQAIADQNNIAVDLNCEEEEEQ